MLTWALIQPPVDKLNRRLSPRTLKPATASFFFIFITNHHNHHTPPPAAITTGTISGRPTPAFLHFLVLLTLVYKIMSSENDAVRREERPQDEVGLDEQVAVIPSPPPVYQYQHSDMYHLQQEIGRLYDLQQRQFREQNRQQEYFTSLLQKLLDHHRIPYEPYVPLEYGGPPGEDSEDVDVESDEDDDSDESEYDD